MATPGDLVACLAKTLGLPLVTVAQHDRNLAEAGLRSKSGRGPSAAKMTAGDAANLLIATVASRAVKDSVEAVQLYGSLTAFHWFSEEKMTTQWRLSNFPVTHLQRLPTKHIFADALTGLIEAAIENIFAPEIIVGALTEIRVNVEFLSPLPVAEIVFDGFAAKHKLEEKLSYGVSHDDKTAVYNKLKLVGDLHQQRFFTLKTINAVGDLLREH